MRSLESRLIYFSESCTSFLAFHSAVLQQKFHPRRLADLRKIDAANNIDILT